MKKTMLSAALAASKLSVMAADIDMESETLVECLQKRPEGTMVPFGINARKQVNYHFLPLDPNDPNSPHVADVADDEHYERLLEIKEGYRAFEPENYEPSYSIPEPGLEDDNFNPRNDANDLLSVDADQVSNEWLANFAKKVLKLTSKQALYDYAVTTYGLEFDYPSTTANEITRSILIKRIEEEKRGQE